MIASTPYFHSEPMASVLADIVAERLKLDRIDLRLWSPGPDSQETDSRATLSILQNMESLYMSSPNEIKNRKVIFISDMIYDEHQLSILQNKFDAKKVASVDYFGLVGLTDMNRESFMTSINEKIFDPGLDYLKRWLSDHRSQMSVDLVEACLRRPEKDFKKIVDKIGRARLWDMWHLAMAERYESISAFRKNLDYLEKMALERHLNADNHKHDASETDPGLLFVDYDETLAKTLSPLSSQTVRDLSLYLETGGVLVVASMQPIGERGLTDYFYQPMFDYLSGIGKSHLLHQVWLMASGGSRGYRPDSKGLLHPDKPLFQTNILSDDFGRLVQNVRSKAGGLCSKFYDRETYLSLQFDSDQSLNEARQILETEFAAEGRFLVLQKKATDPGKRVLHIRPAGISKVNARQFLLQKIKRALIREKNQTLLPADIVTAGDKMADLHGNSDDSGLFIMGAVNFALGDNACPGARTDFLNQYSEGFTRWIHQMASRRSLSLKGPVKS